MPGPGPHPRALSARVISATWWLFALVLLSCYFANLSSSQPPESAHLMIKGFEDLANQDIIEYGTLSGSSTLAFFKVPEHSLHATHTHTSDHKQYIQLQKSVCNSHFDIFFVKTSKYHL